MGEKGEEERKSVEGKGREKKLGGRQGKGGSRGRGVLCTAQEC